MIDEKTANIYFKKIDNYKMVRMYFITMEGFISTVYNASCLFIDLIESEDRMDLFGKISNIVEPKITKNNNVDVEFYKTEITEEHVVELQHKIDLVLNLLKQEYKAANLKSFR